jgi:hypothetical protein
MIGGKCEMIDLVTFNCRIYCDKLLLEVCYKGGQI